jgi:thiol-disulfide isomerase/thioredoxin
MKKLTVVFLCIIAFYTGVAQGDARARITGRIEDVHGGRIKVYRMIWGFGNDMTGNFVKEVSSNQNGEFDIRVPVTTPEIMMLSVLNDSGKHLFNYNLFLGAGDRIFMEGSARRGPKELDVTGRGANNNQYLNIFESDSIELFYGDTTPVRAINLLTAADIRHMEALAEYEKKHKPSAAFMSAWKNQLQYQSLATYYSFEHNNAFGIRAAYKRNFEAWKGFREELYKKAPVNNESAMNAPAYTRFIIWYILRTKEGLWELNRTNRAKFLSEMYGDTTAGAAIFKEDMSNDLQQRIIEKTFTGRAKEYAYVVLLASALKSSEVKNLTKIYNRFKEQYPGSSYDVYFATPMKEVAARQQRILSEKVVFLDSVGKFKTWEEILAQFNGQTVLLDMWGTWCGPCREEMDKNGAAIKNHFANTKLQYLYIANFDEGREKAWKELIAYFNLEGNHILASRQLTEDVMNKVKGRGYPTYVIIHKDGSFELSRADYPMKREVLIRQIEEALAR